MADDFELECSKCPECGQEMQRIVQGDKDIRGDLTTECECKNPNCPLNSVTEELKKRKFHPSLDKENEKGVSVPNEIETKQSHKKED